MDGFAASPDQQKDSYNNLVKVICAFSSATLTRLLRFYLSFHRTFGRNPVLRKTLEKQVGILTSFVISKTSFDISLRSSPRRNGTHGTDA